MIRPRNLSKSPDWIVKWNAYGNLSRLTCFFLYHFFFIFILVFVFFFFPSCLIFFLYARNRRWAPMFRYTRDDFSDTDNGSPQLITITIYNIILYNTRYRYNRRWYNIYSNELQLHANYYYYHHIMHFLFLKYSISWQTIFYSFAFI